MLYSQLTKMDEQTEKEQWAAQLSIGRLIIVIAIAFLLGVFVRMLVVDSTSLRWHDKERSIIKDANGEYWKVTPVKEKIEYIRDKD